MTDLTKPFFGLPNETRRAEKARQNFKKDYQDTWLDEFLAGFFGKEQAGGSVLEEGREKKVKANQAGQVAGIATDIIDPIKSIAPLALGAIRLGGARDLIATHAFNPSSARPLADSGHLRAPSVGITARRENDYAPTHPQFVFSAGKLEPQRFGHATLINRDGYFANPTGYDYTTGKYDPEILAEEVRTLMRNGADTYGTADMRLLQTWPGSSQGLAIGMSPDFKTLQEFEKSPVGAGALRSYKKGPSTRYWEALDKDLREAANEYGLQETSYTKNLLKRALSSPADRISSYEQQLLERARRSPSSMAELKIGENVPISPADTSVFVPRPLLDFRAADLQELAPLRDAGFQLFTPWHVMDPLAQDIGRRPQEWIGKRLPRVAPNTGGFRLPPDLTLGAHLSNRGSGDIPEHSREIWNDFINPQAGTSPPLSVMQQDVPTKVPPGIEEELNSELAQELGIDLSAKPKESWIQGLESIKDTSPDNPLKQLEDLHEMQVIDPDAYAWMKKELIAVAPQKKGLETALPSGKVLKLDSMALEEYNRLLAEADEYLFVADQILKKHPNADQSELVKWLGTYKDAGYHTFGPNWHDLVTKGIAAVMSL